jgi:hypothetical protein
MTRKRAAGIMAKSMSASEIRVRDRNTGTDTTTLLSTL